MGWMDEQIRQRKQMEAQELEDSFLTMVNAVMSDNTHLNMRSDRAHTLDAISQVLHYYKIKAPEELNPDDDPGKQLEDCLQPHGILWRTVKLEKGWRKDAFGVMLGTLKEDHTAVALIPSAIHGYEYWGNDGKKHKITGKAEALFEEDAICFYRPFPNTKLTVPGLFRFMVSSINVADLVFVALVALAAALIGLIIPWVNNHLFSTVLSSKRIDLLVNFGFFWLCAIISRSLFNALYSMLMARISTKVGLNVQSAAMIRVLNMPTSFFRQYNAGELSSRLYSLNSLCTILLSSLLSTVLTAATSLVYVGQIAGFAPKLALPAVLILLFSLLISVLTTLLQEKASQKKMELDSKENGMSYAMLSGIRKIKISGAEKRGFSRWAKLYAKGINLMPTLVRYSGVLTLAVTLIGNLALYIQAIRGGVTPGEFRAFTVAFGSVSGAFAAFSSIISNISCIKPTLNMAKPILSSLPEITLGKQVVKKLSGAIELENICFRYADNAPYVADHLSLKIKPGQYVAIVGKTGCGKSTLVRLMIGFEKPQLGTVSFDGRNVDSLNMRSLRKKIGVVTQNGKLIQGDIYSNIVITAPWLSMDEAWEAAETAGIADDIRAMPMGMRTILSEGTGGISGGQKQRLLIARAIAPKPQILIFDEATSALDNVTQRRIAKALDELHCTRIVIAHRLSTIRHCDRILVLDGGHIIADGKYEELLESCPFFKELVERQRVDA